METAIDILNRGAFPETVIAFGGPMHSGKSLASKHLITEHGFVNHPIAIGVKDMIRVLGPTNEHLYGSLKEQPTDFLCGKTPRYAMQTLASEWGRSLISPTIWVEYWARTVPDVDAVVIDDLRTVEGSKWMQARGAVLVGIERPGIEDGSEARQHETETQFSQIKYDHRIVNDGSIEDFKAKLDALVMELRQGS